MCRCRWQQCKGKRHRLCEIRQRFDQERIYPHRDPSLSGTGNLNVTLYVSGVNQGTKVAHVRTTDPDASGRDSAGTDQSAPGDIDWSGGVTQADIDTASGHINHWRRNALHGTLVRRTNLSYVGGGANAIGESQVFWSASQNWLSYTAHGSDASHCHMYIVSATPSSPEIPPRVFGFVPDTSDYDPAWSPLNTEISFGRADYRILRKGIPGFASDTATKLVAASGNSFDYGDVTPAYSPDGRWVAFSRKNQVTLDYHIWKVPVTGGTPTQLTFTAGLADQYPYWSPDGEWILFDREIGFDAEHHSYKVKSNQSLQSDTITYAVLMAPQGGTDAATPAFAPDGKIVTVGKGTHSQSVLDVRTFTLDPMLSSPAPILNYPDTAFAIHGLHPVLSPHLSPDGTRTALRSRQIWAARRNMNRPPVITQFDTFINDTTVVTRVIDVMQGNTYNFGTAATDPESDPIAYSAYGLQSWMSWDGTQHVLSMSPTTSTPVGTYYVVLLVTTSSGGADRAIGQFRVCPPGGCSSEAPEISARVVEERAALSLGPNPTAGRFVFALGDAWGDGAVAEVYDLAGRRVAIIRGKRNEALTWDGRTQDGVAVQAGSISTAFGQAISDRMARLSL